LKGSFSDVSAPPVQEENGDEEDDIDEFDGFSDTLSQYDGGEVYPFFFNLLGCFMFLLGNEY
jgi:hypothetical protein